MYLNLLGPVLSSSPVILTHGSSLRWDTDTMVFIIGPYHIVGRCMGVCQADRFGDHECPRHSAEKCSRGRSFFCFEIRCQHRVFESDSEVSQTVLKIRHRILYTGI